MKIADLLNKYYPDKADKLFRLFPRMENTARETDVIPWEEEFGIADRNPEAAKEIEFWSKLADMKAISEEEAAKKISEIVERCGAVSITKGVAWFGDEKKVSFRDRVPEFHVIVHELGHVHFEATDPVWASVYGGGEELLHLIYGGRLENVFEDNEKAVSNYIKLLELGYTDRDAFFKVADGIAERLVDKLGLKFEDSDPIPMPGVDELINNHTSARMVLFTGSIPSADNFPQNLLVCATSAIIYRDGFESLWIEFLKELEKWQP